MLTRQGKVILVLVFDRVHQARESRPVFGVMPRIKLALRLHNVVYLTTIIWKGDETEIMTSLTVAEASGLIAAGVFILQLLLPLSLPLILIAFLTDENSIISWCVTSICLCPTFN